jgi:diguanylate cyclase (GGDEF)-like protein/PAS domain S-box-containing protein
MNLLIVDDDHTSLKLLRTQLESEGHALFEAHDGVEALALLNRQRVDAVISDILMPRMDGYRLCHEIRMNERLHDLPFVLYTSSFSSLASPGDEKLALDVGANKYLKKPASVATIVAALHEVIAQPHAAPRAEALGEVEVLKNYNERLVSKLKEKNTELMAAAGKFRSLVEQTIVGIYIVQDDQIVYVNPRMAGIFGWSEEEMTSRTVYDFIVPEDHALVRENMRNRISGAVGSSHYYLRMLHQSGAVLQIELHSSRMDHNGRPAMMGTLLDITERKRAEESLRQSEQRFRTIFEAEPECVKVLGPKGELLEMNAAGLAMLEAGSVDEVTLHSLVKFILPEYRAAFGALGQRVMGGEDGLLEYEIIGLRGTRRWLETHAAPMRDADDRVTMMLGVTRDITERKAAGIRIRHLNRLFAMQSSINALIVRVRDCDELFREACRIAVEAGAFSMAWIGLIAPDTPMVRVAASFGDHADEYLRGIEISTDTETPPGQGPTGTAIRENQPVWIQDFQHNALTAPWHERGARFGWSSLAALPLHQAGVPIGAINLYADELGAFDDEQKQLLVGLASNLSFAIDHIEKEKKLTYLAYYDVLTGLANRTLFLHRVAQYRRNAVSGGHKLAVCLFDLERFKNINDSLGRPAGDKLLQQVARLLTRAVGDANLLARLGADHFAVVIPEVQQEGDVALLVERWMKALLDHPFGVNTSTFRISARVGISLFPDAGSTAEALFKNAEAALKQAKASRNGYLFYTPKIAEMTAGKFVLENQLREAVDKQEFILYYQPKVNLASGKLTSAEALIRWNDPRSGLVPPDRFIPILEETGLIYEVGRWALGKAIEDYLRWQSAGLPAVRIAVNVSPLQLRNRDFIAEIEQAIGIDARAAAGLELELTEGLIMEDVEHSIATLRAIRAMGVSIAIDDFGTGFSSLSYLSKLPLDTLKIARSFVIDMTATPEGLAQVSTIINLAHSLKLKVVAEGVETKEQSRLLGMLGCDEMQGFLLGEAVPDEIFETRYLELLPPGDASRGVCAGPRRWRRAGRSRAVRASEK